MRTTVTRGLIAATLLVLLTACSGGFEGRGERERREAVGERWTTFQQAENRHPLPYLQNFPLRGALAEMASRQDMVNHPWYVYILGMNGNVIGYYVAKTVPINACNFLSSSEDVYKSPNGNLTTTAPSLDGMFYGNAACDAWFFFDQATDALVQIRGINFYASDQPLLLDAEPIVVESGRP